MERTEDDMDVTIEGEEDEDDEDTGGNNSNYEIDLGTLTVEVSFRDLLHLVFMDKCDAVLSLLDYMLSNPSLEGISHRVGSLC